MRSSLPKVLHPVCGRPMVAWPILAAREAGAGRVAVIVSPGRDISAGLPEGVETVEQPEADGTGGAIRAALPLIEETRDGARPLRRRAADLGRRRSPALLAAHEAAAAAATMLTIELEDPGSYGRVVRDAGGRGRAGGRGQGAPATPTAEQLAIREINAGTYAFDAAPLAAALGADLQRQRPGRVLPARRLPGRCARRATRSPPTSPTTSR